MAGKEQLILVVDDHPDNCFLLSSHLERNGFLVIAAENGLEGLKIVKSGASIVAVVTDVEMPIMDGLQLLSEIRRYDSALPVIVVSGRTDLSARVVCDLGAKYFFIKPFSFEELLERILTECRTSGA